MCLWLRWEIWETVIVGKCLEMTEIDWETDKIRILGSWEPLRTVTSLKEWRAMLIPETWLIRGMQPCPSLLFQWKGVGASGEGPGLRASLPINPESLPLGLLCTVKKDPILTRGSSVQIQFSSFLSLSRVWLFGTPWTAAHQASLSITISWSLLKLMSIASVMPSNHVILCRPLLLLPSIFPSIRIFSSESALRIRWPKSWSFSLSISSLNEYSGLTTLILLSKGLSRIFSNTTV